MLPAQAARGIHAFESAVQNRAVEELQEIGRGRGRGRFLAGAAGWGAARKSKAQERRSWKDSLAGRLQASADAAGRGGSLRRQD